MKKYVFLGYFKKLTLPKVLILLPAPLLATLETVKHPLTALILVIIVDLITALVAHFSTLKRKEGRKLRFQDYRKGIHSGGLRNTVQKGYQYGIATIVSFIIEVYGFRNSVNLADIPLIDINAGITETILWSFVIIEVWSVDENLRKTTGVSLIQKLKTIYKTIKSLKE